MRFRVPLGARQVMSPDVQLTHGPGRTVALPCFVPRSVCTSLRTVQTLLCLCAKCHEVLQCLTALLCGLCRHICVCTAVFHGVYDRSPLWCTLCQQNREECDVCGIPLMLTAGREASGAKTSTQRPAKRLRDTEVRTVNMHRLGESFVTLSTKLSPNLSTCTGWGRVLLRG